VRVLFTRSMKRIERVATVVLLAGVVAVGVSGCILVPYGDGGRHERHGDGWHEHEEHHRW
jgi:hypothetical protein